MEAVAQAAAETQEARQRQAEQILAVAVAVAVQAEQMAQLEDPALWLSSGGSSNGPLC
jgi:hypothetical protein